MPSQQLRVKPYSTRKLVVGFIITTVCIYTGVYFALSFDNENRLKIKKYPQLQYSSPGYLAEFISGPEEFPGNPGFSLIKTRKKDNNEICYVVVSTKFKAESGDDIFVQWYKFIPNKLSIPSVVPFGKIIKPGSKLAKVGAE